MPKPLLKPYNLLFLPRRSSRKTPESSSSSRSVSNGEAPPANLEPRPHWEDRPPLQDQWWDSSPREAQQGWFRCFALESLFLWFILNLLFYSWFLMVDAFDWLFWVFCALRSVNLSLGWKLLKWYWLCDLKIA